MRTAAGFVIYRLSNLGVIEYLLMQASYRGFHWTPPKGHLEPGETPIQAAYRETLEEAGIKESQITRHENFQENLQYEVDGKPKEVYYFLGKVENTVQVVLSKEHQDFKWLQIDEAKKITGYKDMQNLLDKCQKFLQK